MDLYGNQNQQGSNPGYGNDSNVGYSPGQTGTVPPAWAKYDFQMRQYRQMYGNENRRLFARYPLTFTAFWYPVITFFCWMVWILAWNTGGAFFDLGPIMGLGAFIVIWALALGFIITAMVLFPIMALMMHRRRGGMFAEYFAWTDQLLPWADFDYYENPERH